VCLGAHDEELVPENSDSVDRVVGFAGRKMGTLPERSRKLQALSINGRRITYL